MIARFRERVTAHGQPPPPKRGDGGTGAILIRFLVVMRAVLRPRGFERVELVSHFVPHPLVARFGLGDLRGEIGPTEYHGAVLPALAFAVLEAVLDEFQLVHVVRRAMAPVLHARGAGMDDRLRP